jgi:hypothetical protein
MDYITYQGVTQDVAKQMMLQDRERLFQKSHSSLEKFGFSTPNNVPTELGEAISLWDGRPIHAPLLELTTGSPNMSKEQTGHKHKQRMPQ